jgi:hypothetical protein
MGCHMSPDVCPQGDEAMRALPVRGLMLSLREWVPKKRMSLASSPPPSFPVG